MLEHADTGDRVVHRFTGKIAVVAQCHGDVILKPFGQDALPGKVKLLLAQRDPMRANNKVFGCSADQRAPTTADVQQVVARLKAKLAADVVQFIALRLIQRFVGGLEVGAGVDPFSV